MWKITRDYLAEQNNDTPDTPESCDWDEAKSKLIELFKFRMLDADEEIYCAGVSSSCDDDNAFAPLDDYGDGALGCVEIQYLNPVNGEYETL